MTLRHLAHIEVNRHHGHDWIELNRACIFCKPLN